MESCTLIRWLEDLTSENVGQVGGKNASLGEMIHSLKEENVRVPDGFATTAEAYWQFLRQGNLKDEVRQHLDALEAGERPLSDVGPAIRKLFLRTEFPEAVETAIRQAYRDLSLRYDREDLDVAVRSSATAEDLPEASFAGQQETFLNIRGEDDLLEACRRCYASLFTNRAISYRQEKGFSHMQVALSVGVQRMVRSDLGSAGVMFSIDTETGFPDVAIINAAWGLGEMVVQGSVTPDQYTVFKPLLKGEDGKASRYRPIVQKKRGTKEKKMVYANEGSESTKTVATSSQEQGTFVLEDDEILQLGRWAATIEAHYGLPMDMEWAKDGETGELFIVQARPETVQSQKVADTLRTYKLKQKGEEILSGLSIGAAIAVGKVSRILSAEDIDQVEDDTILVTEMTDPDWVPIMKRVAGIVTDQGGRTCHAAIVSRELGIPAIVGTGDATHVLKNGQEVTLSCAEGDQGKIYAGILDYESNEVDLSAVPQTRIQVMMNIASPAAAFRWWQLPVQGIGLARMEFIINTIIKIHPMALIHYDELQDREAWKQIRDLTQGYPDKQHYFVENLARGIGRIAASQYPEPVIVRLSDFKTNEYADLIGGAAFEPKEANPMLGFRGAARYTSDRYRQGFDLECQAIKRVRDELGFDNIVVMVPFCRTLEEADGVLAAMAENGLKRGESGLQVYVMAETPANVELADLFSDRFDGFSIGSNDLTQLVLGVDRDSSELSHLFDERNLAVKRTIHRLIATAHEQGRKVGICGQAPSDYPEFAEFLVDAGIDTISLNPDSVIQVKRCIAERESSGLKSADFPDA